MARQIFNDNWASGGAKTDPGGVKLALGWIAEKPPYQYFNWLLNKYDQMLQHFERGGIAIWDAATVYDINGVARGSDGFLYQAVASNTGVNPVGTVVAPTYATSSWKRVTPPATTSVAGLSELADNTETTALSDATRVVTPAGLNALAASVTQRGIAELATGSETAGLTDPARVVTPLGLASLVASTSLKGIVQLATDVEVIDGTNATKAVTPQALGALLQSMGSPGYKIFPGGLIVQWGSNEIDSSNSYDVTLPIAFPANHFVAIASSHIGSLSETGPHHGARPHPGTPLTKVQLSTAFNDHVVYWVCIGN